MSEFIRYKSLRSIAGFEPIINTKKLVPSLTSKNSSQISRLVCADNPSLIKRPSLEFRERQIDSCKETAQKIGWFKVRPGTQSNVSNSDKKLTFDHHQRCAEKESPIKQLKRLQTSPVSVAIPTNPEENAISSIKVISKTLYDPKSKRNDSFSSYKASKEQCEELCKMTGMEIPNYPPLVGVVMSEENKEQIKRVQLQKTQKIRQFISSGLFSKKQKNSCLTGISEQSQYTMRMSTVTEIN